MKIAYITLATDKRYLIGAYNLYKSYLKINSKYPFYCMVWNDTDLTGYEDLPVKIVPKIIPTNPRWGFTNPPVGMFTKLNVWLLSEFDYLLFLDCDIILYKNIDILLDECANLKENEISIFRTNNKNNPHDLFCTAWMFIKPSHKTYLNSLKYLNMSCNEQEIFTYMYDNKELIPKENSIRAILENTFHFNNWYKQQKYWENKLCLFIYTSIINDKKLIPYIKETQRLVAIEPDEYITDIDWCNGIYRGNNNG